LRLRNQETLKLWLPRGDSQLPGAADDGLAIDNVRFSAIPEPSTFVLLALGVVGLLAIRRR
jgi:hypothetical protein